MAPAPLLTAVLTAVLAALLTLGPAGPAAASTAGSLSVTPANGRDDSTVTLRTSGPCPSGTNLIARIFGHGFPAEGQVIVGNSALTAYDRTPTGGYVVPLQMPLRDLMNLQHNPTPLAGTYRLVVTCRTNTGRADLGDFTGTLRFASPRSYVAAPPKPAPKPGPKHAGPAVPAATPTGTPGSGAPAAAGPHGQAGAGTVPGQQVPAAHTSTAASGGMSLGSIGLLVVGGCWVLAGAVFYLRQRRTAGAAAGGSRGAAG